MKLASYSILHHHHAILEVAKYVVGFVDMLAFTDTTFDDLKKIDNKPPPCMYTAELRTS